MSKHARQQQKKFKYCVNDVNRIQAQTLYKKFNPCRETLIKRFIQGEHRTQSTLLPEMLDDYVTEENPVRVIDVFVGNLDLKQLGF